MELEDKLKVFLASSPNTKYSIPVIVLKHSSFGALGFWRENYRFQSWVLEDGNRVDLEPSNLDVKLSNAENDLDQKINVAIGTVDSEDRIRGILDNIPLYSEEEIAVEFREYLSDETSSGPVATAFLQAEGISYEVGVLIISAAVPRLNNKTTGNTYNIRTFPTLRGFLP